MTIQAKSEYGTFRDSLKAPVHRWFTYPAGYSHKFVEAKVREYGLGWDSTIADPFLGTGTTSVTAKMLGINSVGIEAHSFVYWVAKTKMFLHYDIDELVSAIPEVSAKARDLSAQLDWENIWPPLVYKCFTDDNLRQLAGLRQAINDFDDQPHVRDFLKLALTSTLRIVTTAGSGWPYIAPSKYQSKKVNRHAFDEFQARCRLMVADIQQVQALDLPYSSHDVLSGDARKMDSYVADETIDLIVTSPPYLNNYDYADRTRLETYFWGIHESWADITREVRDHLVVAATTQVRMSTMNGVRECPGIREVDERIHRTLTEIIARLGEMRAVKKGRKTYDYMVAGYFEDMLQVLTSAWNVLKPDGRFVLVLGDSAPYGVHIPTELIFGELAVAVGFSSFEIEQIRTRGGKWGHNPQRHNTPLRECILTIVK